MRETEVAFAAAPRLSKKVALLPTGPAMEQGPAVMHRGMNTAAVVMEEESFAIPPLYGIALLNRTPLETALEEVMASRRLLVRVEGEAGFIATAQTRLNDARFPGTAPGMAAPAQSGAGVMEATGEASMPQMARLGSFTAILSVILRVPGGAGVIVLLRATGAEMEGMVPDYVLLKAASPR
jgi:hypothetical protein